MKTDDSFVHERHKPQTSLVRPREIVLAIPPLRSQINLARIIRTAGCCGLTRIFACGSGKIDPKIARDALQQVEIQRRRTLPPVLKELTADGFQLVGLEQASNSVSLHSFSFPHRTALVIGHERLGLEQDALNLLQHVVEIPVWGMPFSYNVATATAMALYEYCRQYPQG